jgi:hypothetical protein
MDEISSIDRSSALLGCTSLRWNRRDICQAYAVLYFAAARRAEHIRKCGRETYAQLKRIGIRQPFASKVSSLTRNGLAIYAARSVQKSGRVGLRPAERA